jgi:hypothetical protein
MNLLKQIRYIPARSYSAEAINYRDRVLANGGTISDTTLAAVDKFVLDCKGAGVWDKLLDVGVLAGGNLSAAMVKLVYPGGAPSVLTNVNFVAGDYVETGANGGLLGDGATKYLNTGLAVSTYLPDNAHLSFYLREDVGAAGNRGLLGSLGVSNQYWIGALTPSVAATARLGQTATATSAEALNKGFYVGSRTASNQLALYKNGVLAANDTTNVSHTKPTTNLLVFAFMSSGVAAGFLPGRGSFYSIGQALSDPETLALHLAVRALQTSLNRSIN